MRSVDPLEGLAAFITVAKHLSFTKAAEELGMSRAAVLRDAVAVYKARVSLASGSDWIKRGAGYWSGREGLADGVTYQRAIREDRTSHKDG